MNRLEREARYHAHLMWADPKDPHFYSTAQFAEQRGFERGVKWLMHATDNPEFRKHIIGGDLFWLKMQELIEESADTPS